MLENRYLYPSGWSIREGYVEVTIADDRFEKVAVKLQAWAVALRFLIGVVSPVVILVNLYLYPIPRNPRAFAAFASIVLLFFVVLRFHMERDIEDTVGVHDEVEVRVN